MKRSKSTSKGRCVTSILDKFGKIIFAAVFCAVDGSAAEISSLSPQQISSTNLLNNPYLLKHELKLVDAYKWSFEGADGVLLTATPYGINDPGECVVLSANSQRIRLLAVSRLLYKCKWQGDMPEFRTFDGVKVLRFHNNVDVTGRNIEYQNEFLDLIFDRKNKDFCMLDVNAAGKPACKRFGG